MVYNGYYKVMSNIPKMGHLPTPANCCKCFRICQPMSGISVVSEGLEPQQIQVCEGHPRPVASRYHGFLVTHESGHTQLRHRHRKHQQLIGVSTKRQPHGCDQRPVMRCWPIQRCQETRAVCLSSSPTRHNERYERTENLKGRGCVSQTTNQPIHNNPSY